MKTAVMLLAHGTKEVDASEPVHQYAKALAEQTKMKVVPCLREFIEPSVPTVVGELVKEGYQKILVIPYFLFSSGHVTRDITDDLNAEKRKYPQITFEVGRPIGFDPAMVEVLKHRLQEIQRK